MYRPQLPALSGAARRVAGGALAVLWLASCGCSSPWMSRGAGDAAKTAARAEAAVASQAPHDSHAHPAADQGAGVKAGKAWKFGDVRLASCQDSLPPPPLPKPVAPPSAEESVACDPVGPAPLRFPGIRRLEELRPEQIRLLSIDDVLRAALDNNAVVRDDRQFLAPASTMLANPDLAASAFDPSIQATSPNGEEAALAAFDAQAAAGAQWGENALQRSNGFLTGQIPGQDLLVARSGSLYGRLDKPMATGAVASLVHAWNYVPNSLTNQAFNSRYAGYLRGELRQPLWAGRGRDFTSVAGPINSINPNPGRGVAIARLDQNITVADFESRMQLLLKQTVEIYWDLWLAHETYRAQSAALASAEQLCRRVQGRGDVGLDGGEAANRAYAEENLFEWQRAVDNALSDVLEAENRLRRLTGMKAGDGQVLVPTSPPHVGQLVPDWEGAVNTALCNRVELRQQQMRIQSLDMQCAAARSLTHPQFDVVAGAQLNGTGESLIQGDATAVDELIDADHAGWNVGFEFSMPLGFRLARTRVQNLQFRLAKARAALRVQQAEINHELTHAFHELDRTYAAVGTAAGRRDAAQRRLAAVQADYDAGRTSLDLLLRTQVSVAESQRGYLQSVAGYNKALVDLCYRQGILLRDHSVVVAEAVGGGRSPKSE